jgi:hypothetical protein
LICSRQPAVSVTPLKKSTNTGCHGTPSARSMKATLKALPDCEKACSLYMAGSSSLMIVMSLTRPGA